MDSTAIYNQLAESASTIQRHGGHVPSQDPVLRAFFAAFIWQTGFLGVHTAGSGVCSDQMCRAPRSITPASSWRAAIRG
jgi:hypothetical protein